MTILGPFAFFGVLEKLVVPGDAAATASNIIASEGLFRSGIAAFLIVIIADIAVAWALYVLLSPLDQFVAQLVAWLRLAYAAVYAAALVHLMDAAQILNSAGQSPTGELDQIHAQAMSAIGSFRNGWDIGLAIFGLHLVGVGILLVRSTSFPRFLGFFVALAGGGYLLDSFGAILSPDYLHISALTAVGEALLIPWLLWGSVTGFRSDSDNDPGPASRPASKSPASVAS